MKKIITLLTLIIAPLFLFIFSIKDTYAANCTLSGNSFNTGDTITINVSDIGRRNQDYNLVMSDSSFRETIIHSFKPTSSNPGNISVTIPNVPTDKYSFWIYYVGPGAGGDSNICNPRNIDITNGGSGTSTVHASCTAKLGTDKKTEVTGTKFKPSTTYTVFYEGTSQGPIFSDSSGNISGKYSVDEDDAKDIVVSVHEGSVTVASCGKIDVSGAGTSSGNKIIGSNPCTGSGTSRTCSTAIGNISTDPTTFFQRVLSVSLGLAGGIALILMVYGSIRILASSGDPKRVGEGREIIIAALVGLLFLIFSVLILRYIGITLLPENPFR